MSTLTVPNSKSKQKVAKPPVMERIETPCQKRARELQARTMEVQRSFNAYNGVSMLLKSKVTKLY
ncbi:MAG: hypothetical protein F6K10_32175 [Moorea sp. SIO2B7]|nr:hypothetical protein [Moorena sp. SIO2B7]